MKICIVGTNFDKFPIIDLLVEDMRESGEEVTLVNWFVKQTEEFVCDGDVFIYVDIYPLRTDMPCIRIERGMSEDKIMELINDLCNTVHDTGEKKNDNTPLTEKKEVIVEPPFVDSEEQYNNEIKISTSITMPSVFNNINGFLFTIDGQQVYLSKEDADYLIKVFEIAKENGYTLEKVIIDEKDTTESRSEDISEDMLENGQFCSED